MQEKGKQLVAWPIHFIASELLLNSQHESISDVAMFFFLELQSRTKQAMEANENRFPHLRRLNRDRREEGWMDEWIGGTWRAGGVTLTKQTNTT